MFTFTAHPYAVSAIQFTGINAAEVARFQADHLKSMDLPRNKVTDSFISETVKALDANPKLRGQWLVADPVALRWIPDEVFSLLYHPSVADSTTIALSQRAESGMEIVSFPALLEIAVDPLDGFLPSEAIVVAAERLREQPLSVTLGGVPIGCIIPSLKDPVTGQAAPTDDEEAAA